MSTASTVLSEPSGGQGHLAGDLPQSPEPAPSGRHGAGFWLVSAAFGVVMAFSAAPAPLYVLYQRRDHFSTFMVTVVFAVYAVGVVISLLLAGHVSDTMGRKRVLIPAIALELVSAAAFLAWPDLPSLIVARLINGLGVGLISATATAHLHELHSRHRPQAGPARFELVSTAVNIGGLAVGPLLSGFLAQYVTQPLRVPYAVFLVLLVLALAAVTLAPETVEVRLDRPAWRPQRIRAHGAADRYLIAVAGAFSTFAIFGLFTSVAPGFVAGTMHHPSRALAGTIVFIVFGGAALSQMGAGLIRQAARVPAGLALQAVGLVLVAVGMGTANLAPFLIGGGLAGVGGGILFKTAIGSVAAMAAPELRGEALAGLFTISYAGMIISAVGVGIATQYIAATTALYWFTGLALALLAAIGVLLARTSRRGAANSR